MKSILVGNKYIIQTLKSHQMHNNNINGQFESAEIMSNLILLARQDVFKCISFFNI